MYFAVDQFNSIPCGSGLLIDIFPSHCVKSATLPANQIMKLVSTT